MTEIVASLRRLARAPRFSLGVVIMLALGLGAAASLFSLVDAVLLRPLPFAEPDRLVWVWSTRVDRDRAFFSIPNFLDTRERAHRAYRERGDQLGAARMAVWLAWDTAAFRGEQAMLCCNPNGLARRGNYT